MMDRIGEDMSYDGIEQYHFPDYLLARVRECYKNDNWHGPFELLCHWCVIAASIAISMWTWDNGPVVVGCIVYVLAVWFIGGRQRALADILHQAAHRTLMRNYKVGRTLGTFFSGYLILQSFTGYYASHVRDHHGNLGDPTVDPDYIQYQRKGLCGSNMTQATIRRYLLHLASPLVMLSYIAYLFRDRMIPEEEQGRERVVRLTYICAIAGVLVVTGHIDLLALYWLVPLITTQVWIGSLIELVEHYPLIETAPRIDLYVSRNRHCSRVSNFLLGITPHEGYHLIHHKFAAVPPWRHHEVHQVLLEDPVYAALNSVCGWREILREVLTLHSKAIDLANSATRGS
jgi:fatty acid desaturase